ncbi:hypothetical protein A4G20_06570 [Pasteurellaceae bacterium RH1A]|nr:hypothetical protein A4G20_06570 [Pasteurellaceae bacterium RH1A]
MKKVITLAAVLALSVSTIVEAKRGGAGRSMSMSRPAATAPAKPSVMQSQGGANTQRDANFSSAAPQAAPAAQAAAPRGNAMANVAMGAAAGYLLGDMLSPSAAQAQPAAGQPLEQLGQQVAGLVPTFKSFDSSNPALIGKAGDQNLFCLNGAMFLINGANNQPSAIVDASGQALACQTAQ